jgi:hypothetical protein
LPRIVPESEVSGVKFRSKNHGLKKSPSCDCCGSAPNSVAVDDAFGSELDGSCVVR